MHVASQRRLAPASSRYQLRSEPVGLSRSRAPDQLEDVQTLLGRADVRAWLAHDRDLQPDHWRNAGGSYGNGWDRLLEGWTRYLRQRDRRLRLSGWPQGDVQFDDYKRTRRRTHRDFGY